MFTLRRYFTFLSPLTVSGLVFLFVMPGRAESAEAWCMFHPALVTSEWFPQALLVIASTGAGDKLDIRMSDPQAPPKQVDVTYEIGPAWSVTEEKYSKRFERDGRVGMVTIDRQSGRIRICSGETCAAGKCGP
jgi:hypothetical protein